MNSEEGRSSAALGRVGQVALPALMAVLVTLVVIRESMIQGRLASPPYYDDVAYMMDGASRLNLLYEGGVPLLRRDLAKGPPHSPFSTGMAMAGFALFGMQDWAPYAMNVIVAGLVFGLAAYLFRRETFIRRSLVLIALGAIPVTCMSVREFRPDIAAAALLGWGVAVALDPPGWAGGRRRACLVGAIFGVVLLTKTSTSPLTIAVFGLTVLMSAAVNLPPEWGRGWWRMEASLPDVWSRLLKVVGRLAEALEQLVAAALREGLLATLTLAVVTAPYYAVAWHDVFEYIERNIFGDRADMWVTEGGPAYHATYYLTGPGGQFMLGGSAWVLALLACAGAALAWRRSDRRWRIGSVGLAAIMALCYTVCTVNLMKQGFLGLPFQIMLILAALLAVRLSLSVIPVHVRTWGTAALGAACVLSLSTFRFPNTWASQDSTKVQDGLRFYDEAYAAVRREVGRKPAVVLVTFTGPVNATNLQYRSVKDGATIQFRSHEAAKAVQDYDYWLNRAGWVVAAQSGTGLTNDRFPSGKLHDAMIARLDGGGDFERVGSIQGVNRGRGFFLYRRVKGMIRDESGAYVHGVAAAGATGPVPAP